MRTSSSRKKPRQWTLMNVKIYFYKSRGPGDQSDFWTLKVNKLDFERIKNALWRLIEHDYRDVWNTERLMHVRTQFTDINKLLATLKKSSPVE